MVLIAIVNSGPLGIVIGMAIERIVVGCGVIEGREGIFSHSRFRGFWQSIQFFEEISIGGISHLLNV